MWTWSSVQARWLVWRGRFPHVHFGPFRGKRDNEASAVLDRSAWEWRREHQLLTHSHAIHMWHQLLTHSHAIHMMRCW